MRRSLLDEFLRLEAASGFLLFGAAILALILANSPLAWLYEGLLDTAVSVQVGALKISKLLLLWINDGLMAVFFLLVGLEIKREVADGELSSWDRAALPAVAAVGGIAVPAAVYLLINLHPWVSFAIMPIFAFANAGVSFAEASLGDVLAPLPLGIAAGLFIGKQVGVFAASWAAIRLGLCRLPEGISWQALYGVSLLTGIGFTMSLFIGTLAFGDPAHAAGIRLGVFLGSILSGLCGYLLLRALGSPKAASDVPKPTLSHGVADGP